MKKRVGRPRKKLGKAKTLITHRIRVLVDMAHEGNLNEASRVTGIPHPTLRGLYTGRSANPSVRTLEALGKPYSIDVGWFADAKRPETGTLAGVIGRLPPTPLLPGPKDQLREVVIPFSAWPMYETFNLLWGWLDTQDTDPKRMIVGDATEKRDYSLRLTTFLFQPLLDAERVSGDVNLIQEILPRVGQKYPTTPEDDTAWVERLRALGRMWQRAIPDVLAKARADLERLALAKPDQS